MKILFAVVFMVIGTAMLASCGNQSYGPEEAAKHGDIVDHYGKITNVQRLDTFLDNVQKQHKDKVRVMQYTEEGDPIFHNLTYDGANIKYKFDNSQDEFGKTDIRTSTCSGFSKASNIADYGTRKVEVIEYKLIGCSGSNAKLAEAFIVTVPPDNTQ